MHDVRSRSIDFVSKLSLVVTIWLHGQNHFELAGCPLVSSDHGPKSKRLVTVLLHEEHQLELVAFPFVSSDDVPESSQGGGRNSAGEGEKGRGGREIGGCLGLQTTPGRQLEFAPPLSQHGCRILGRCGEAERWGDSAKVGTGRGR